MTPRTIFPESRIMPVCVAVALILVMVAVQLAAGCIGCMLSPTGCIEPGYVPDRDIAVVKITSNGSVSWLKVIDNGEDDTADDVIQTLDGGFVISARLSDIDNKRGRYPYLIKFSSDGDFVWNRSIYELKCDSGALTNNQKGEIIVVAGNDFCRFNSHGELISNITLDTYNSGNLIITTNDGGVIIAGAYDEIKPFTKEEFISSGRSEGYWVQLCGNRTPPDDPYCGGNQTVIHTVITKLDQNGSVVWHHSLREYGFTQIPSSVIELQDNQGYRVKVINQSFHQNSVTLDINGNFIEAMPVMSIERDGKIFTRQPFNNTSPIILQTEDGSYVSAGFLGSTQYLESYLYHRGTEGNLHVVKLFPEGKLQWDIAVPNITVNKVEKIIQTSDGDYVILCENDKHSSPN